VKYLAFSGYSYLCFCCL